MHQQAWKILFCNAKVAFPIATLVMTAAFGSFTSTTHAQNEEQGVFGTLELTPPPKSTQAPPDWNSFSPLPSTPQSINGSNVWQSETLDPVPSLTKPIPDLNTSQGSGPIKDDPFLPPAAGRINSSPSQSWQPAPAPVQQAPTAGNPYIQAMPGYTQGHQGLGQAAPIPVQASQPYPSQAFPAQTPTQTYPSDVYSPAFVQAPAATASQQARGSRLNLGGKLKSIFARKSNKQPYFDPTPLRIRFQAEALYLSHSGGDDEPFILDPSTFAPLFRHSDIGPGSDVGGRFRLLYQSEGGSGYEFTYTRFDEFRDEVTFDVGIPVFFGGMPASADPPYTSSYSSKLNNYELNAFVRKNSWLRIGGGFRVMDLRENFDTEGGSGGFFSDTDNDLFGGQLTVDLYRRISRFANLELGGRFGIYHNNIDVRFFSATRNLHYEDEAFSTNIDLNAGLAIQMTVSTMLRVGYQRMMIYDAALAPNQSTGFGFGDTSAPANLADLKLDGFYCGVTTRF